MPVDDIAMKGKENKEEHHEGIWDQDEDEEDERSSARRTASSKEEEAMLPFSEHLEYPSQEYGEFIIARPRRSGELTWHSPSTAALKTGCSMHSLVRR